jgi:hypothetical protein
MAISRFALFTVITKISAIVYLLLANVDRADMAAEADYYIMLHGRVDNQPA